MCCRRFSAACGTVAGFNLARSAQPYADCFRKQDLIQASANLNGNTRRSLGYQAGKCRILILEDPDAESIAERSGFFFGSLSVYGHDLVCDLDAQMSRTFFIR